jgi:hypothetical protein
MEEYVKIILRETGLDDLYEFTLWEPTTTHLQANYQLLVDQQSEASASQSVHSMAVQTPIGPGTTSNSE